MRLGVFQGAFAPGLGLAECFRLARAAGFEGVELSLERGEPVLPEAVNETTRAVLDIETSVGLATPRAGALRLASTVEDAAALRRQAEQAGVALPSLSTMQLFFYPLSSPTPVVRERAVQIVRKMLQVTAQLGGDLILIQAGMVTQEVSYQEAWERSFETLAPLVPYAAQLGVSIGLENVWNKFLLSPLEFRDYIDAFHSPYVGAYFDVANILRYGYPDQWIETLGPRLKRVHFKDYRLDLDNIRAFANLLQGDVPWERVTRALRRVGYEGWVVAEVGPYGRAADQAIPDTAAALRRILEL